MEDETTTAAAATRPSMLVLRARKHQLLAIAMRHGASNVRIFGSVARGDAEEQSDIDLLLDLDPEARGLAYFRMIEDLRRDFESTLHRDLDVIDAAALDTMREQVLSEAVPL